MAPRVMTTLVVLVLCIFTDSGFQSDFDSDGRTGTFRASVRLDEKAVTD